MNKVDVVKSSLDKTIEDRNADGWKLIGSVVPCLIGGLTHFILTWEKDDDI